MSLVRRARDFVSDKMPSKDSMKDMMNNLSMEKIQQIIKSEKFKSLLTNLGPGTVILCAALATGLANNQNKKIPA